VANREGSQPPRIYVDPKLNDQVDTAHVTLMARHGIKISKTDFVNAVLRVGLAQGEKLDEAISGDVPESVTS
jgi:hypothetical protein